MSALVRSELLKVRTTRGWYVYLVVTASLSALAAAAVVASASGPDRSGQLHADLIEAIGITGLVAIVLGITSVTAEFRHGTVTPTFLAAPRRERVVAAKALAVTAVSLLLAALTVLAIAVVALPWAGSDIHLADGEVTTGVAQGVLGIVLAGLLGLAVGSLVHGQVSALVGTLAWIFVFEGIAVVLLGLVDLGGVGEFLPGQALDAADGTGGAELLSYPAGVAVSLGWIALVGAAGTERVRRRDLT